MFMVDVQKPTKRGPPTLLLPLSLPCRSRTPLPHRRRRSLPQSCTPLPHRRRRTPHPHRRRRPPSIRPLSATTGWTTAAALPQVVRPLPTSPPVCCAKPSFRFFLNEFSNCNECNLLFGYLMPTTHSIQIISHSKNL